MDSTPERDWSVAEIAASLNTTASRVGYAIRSRRIEPARRVGNVRAFDRAGVEAVRAALTDVARKKGEVL